MAAFNGATHDVANRTTKHTAASPTDAYKLPRDAKESQRLDAQHTALQANIGFLLHPRIVETLPATDEVEIADIGTGTGAWLLELATEFKDKRFKFTGLDISAAQFPADPPNGMAFATHNILSPVPSHLLARFDIIHVRFLVLGLPSGSWPQAIENLHAMLRPSGWLQWSEPDFRSIIPLPLSSPITPATSTLLQTGRSTILSLVAHGTQRHNLAFHDSETLSSHFATAGFTNVSEIAFASDRVPETRLAISRVFAKGIAGLQKMICAGNGEEAGGQWGDEGEGRKVLNCVGEACERGEAYWRLELNVIIGRKSGI